LYEDVVAVLEPLAADQNALTAEQRFEANLLLARAHRALGNLDKAHLFSLRATDQAVERKAPAQLLEHASLLAQDGRYPEARRTLCQLLARGDALSGKEQTYRVLAEARLADLWFKEARASGQLAPLPGAAAQPVNAPAAPTATPTASGATISSA